MKVFGSGWKAATGFDETDRSGIVCFITVAGFLNGPGFQKMREDLRRDCAAIWVIDCSPEGHQPEVNTRVFEGVQQPVCIVLAARTPNKDRDQPARLKFMALPEGHRKEVKFPALAKLSLRDRKWVDGPTGWRDPLLPEQEGAWPSFPALDDMFVYNGSGVMPGRVWVIAPDPSSLSARWEKLVQERDADKKEAMFHPHLRGGEPGDKHIRKSVARPLSGHPTGTQAIIQETRSATAPVRYAFRTLDRQWIIPDARVINQPNPTLWDSHSDKQVYVTALEAHSPSSGPAISFAGLIPDLHHYKGNFGGRAFPLWRNAETTVPNVNPALLTYLAKAYGTRVAPEDVMAYLAAVMAHPAFTARFQKDLVRPGLRVPLTADASMFAKAVALGREVVWLHTYGERFADPKASRPEARRGCSMARSRPSPRAAPYPARPNCCPTTCTTMPPSAACTSARATSTVAPEVWAYEVSGMNVLRQWFSYRKRDRSRPIIGDRRPPSPLGDIQPDHWPHEYTTDLMNLLNVLGRLVLLEPRQAALLTRLWPGGFSTARLSSPPAHWRVRRSATGIDRAGVGKTLPRYRAGQPN